MRSLVDFLNHGILPFVGRTNEVVHLLKFWEGAAEAEGLRAMLVLGEAGVGKSRMVEELIPQIADKGGVVLHIRLRPESTITLAPLIARAFGGSETAHALLRTDPEENRESIAGALRRLARLRPTLLVIEDIHLLEGEPLGELKSILDSLSDELLSLLVLARPLDLPARGVLEPYLVEEMALRGLDAGALGDLMRSMLSSAIEPEFLALLQSSTLGNPLAIRSALRGVLKSAEPESGRLNVSTEMFASTLKRNVGLLSEGMTAHLAGDELHAAGQLSLLGEVFARETAAMMIDDAGQMLERLSFRGIITISSTSTQPLPGDTSAEPLLSFTHTLLHRHLVENTEADARRLMSIIGAGKPLYSTLPFTMMADVPSDLSLPDNDIRLAIGRMLTVAQELTHSYTLSTALGLVETTSDLVSRYKDSWPDIERIEWESDILYTRLLKLQDSLPREEYAQRIEDLLRLTENAASDRLAERHLLGLGLKHNFAYREHYTGQSDAWEEVEAFIARFPQLRYTHAYIGYLRGLARMGSASVDDAMVRQVEQRLEEIVESGSLSEELRIEAWRTITPFFLDTFSSKDELDGRLRQMAELSLTRQGGDLAFIARRISLLFDIGQMEEAVQLIDRFLPKFKESGELRLQYGLQLRRLFCLTAFGIDLDEAGRSIATLCSSAPELLRPALENYAGLFMSTAGLLRADIEWTRWLTTSFVNELEQIFPEVQVMLAESPQELSLALPSIIAHPFSREEFRTLLRYILPGSDVSRTETIDLISEYLRRETIRVSTIAIRTTVIKLVEDNGLADELQSDIHRSLVDLLGWLAERSLFAFMTPLVDRFENYLSKKEIKGWRDRIGAIAKQKRIKPPSEESMRLRITMLGTVEITLPDGTVTPMRGGRLRTMLGLMTADRMQKKPLDTTEFRYIAAGGEEDPEHARKTMNGGVFRLRDLMGEETITTDGETPQLNLDRVTVDLLEAQGLLREASSALRDGVLMRAYPAALRALEITRGEVPFPALYDEFFEAAREDFEHLLRSTTVRVAKELLREDDPASAEELLRRGYEAMPEDEEIAEMFREALGRLGRRTEAERVRLRDLTLA